jgi:thiol-disulfide isomerase/thioredoxin
MPLDKEAAVNSFAEKAKAIKGEDEGIKLSVVCQRGVGSAYATITSVEDVFKGGKTNLEHKQGEVWLLDFWATWCPPC